MCIIELDIKDLDKQKIKVDVNEKTITIFGESFVEKK